MADSIQTLRARVAALTRHGSDLGRIALAKHELAVAVATGYIERICGDQVLTGTDLFRLAARLLQEDGIRVAVREGLTTRT